MPKCLFNNSLNYAMAIRNYMKESDCNYSLNRNGNINPLVSVWMVTYNHEKFIRQAVESVLNQVVDFQYEIVIGEDCSTDSTAAICMDLKEKYPSIIKLLLSPKNIGMGKNVLRTLRECKGRYVAMLEGDDYWSDIHKLQKQVTFLENNNNYVGCFHNTEERYEDDDSKASFLFHSFPLSGSIKFQHLTTGNKIPTCSVVFRGSAIKDLPEWYSSLPLSDWTLHLLTARTGDFWYIPKVMAVHRLHSESTWMLKDPHRNIQYIIEAYDTMIGSDSFSPTQLMYLNDSRNKFARQFTLWNRAKNYLARKFKNHKSYWSI